MDILSRFSLVGLAFALLFASGATRAAILSCDGCSYWAYEQTALAAGVGDHYVVDVRNNELHRFLVRRPAAGEPWEATPAPVDPWIQEQFDIVETALRLNDYAKTHRVEVPADSPFMPGGFSNGNAYDVALTGTTRTQLGLALVNRFASSSAMLGNAVNALWNALQSGSSAVLGQDLAIIVVVRWPDGSQSAFRLDKNNLQVAALEPGGSIDNEGNVIPAPGAVDNPGAYEGVWNFSNRNNVDRWLRNAAIFGIPVGRDGSSGSMLTCGIVCEGVEGACRITCTRR